jgi:mannosyltransferase
MIEPETGAVVAAGDGRALEQAIAPYLANPELCEKAGKSALVHVRQNFPLAKEAGRIRDVYEDLFASGSQP